MNRPTKKRYTYTAKVEYIEREYGNMVIGGWKILLYPRNGKPIISEHVYRSKSTAEFVARKLINSIIKGEF